MLLAKKLNMLWKSLLVSQELTFDPSRDPAHALFADAQIKEENLRQLADEIPISMLCLRSPDLFT